MTGSSNRQRRLFDCTSTIFWIVRPQYTAKEWGWQYVFPSSKLSVDPRSGKIRRHHIAEKTIQNGIKEAMNGVNIREIQNLLGHKHVETTMIYTHVLRDMVSAPRSPLDNLYNKKPLHP